MTSIPRKKKDKPYIVPEKKVLAAALKMFHESEGIALFRRNVFRMKQDEGTGKERVVGNGVKGMSDIEGIVKTTCPRCRQTRYGVHCEIECKRPKEKPKPHQVDWILRVRRLGGIAFILMPDEKDVLLKGLRQQMLDGINCLCPQCASNAAYRQGQQDTERVIDVNIVRKEPAKESSVMTPEEYNRQAGIKPTITSRDEFNRLKGTLR